MSIRLTSQVSFSQGVASWKKQLSQAGIVLSVGFVASWGVSWAQPPQGEGGFPGGGPPMRRGGRGGGPMGRPMTLATMPVSTLSNLLNLTKEQESKIAQIQQSLRQQMREMMLSLQEGGERPDPEQMQARMEKMRETEKTATARIEAALSDEQKKNLPQVMKEVQAMGQLGIPMPIYADLKLTAEQRKKLTEIAASLPKPPQPGESPENVDWESLRSKRQEAMQKAMAVLTDAQRKMIQEFRQSQPRGPFGEGGRGGQRPPQGGPPEGAGAPF